MLIPVLSLDPDQVPPLLPDAHVIKLIAELFQIACTVLRQRGVTGLDDADLVKPTHPNHAYTRWARESPVHLMYTLRLAMALCQEKRRRWPENPPHVYEDRCRRVIDSLPLGVRHVLRPEEVPPVCTGTLSPADQQRVQRIAARDPIGGFVAYFRLAKRTNPALWHFCGGRLKTLGCSKRVGKSRAQGKASPAVLRCVVNEPQFWNVTE